MTIHERSNASASGDDPSTPHRLGTLERSVRLIRPWAETFARRLVKNPADVEEIVQDVLVSAILHLDRFEGRSSLRTWVYSLVRSSVSRRFRRARPVPCSSVAPESIDDTDPQDPPREWALRHDLEQAMAELSSLDRRILVERDIDGYGAELVARHVHMSVPAVKARLHRARLSLRERLSDRH